MLLESGVLIAFECFGSTLFQVVCMYGRLSISWLGLGDSWDLVQVIILRHLFWILCSASRRGLWS